MNIAVFSRSTTEHFLSGGMETQLKSLVEGLVKNGHQVTVITTSYPINEEIFTEDKIISDNGINYFYIGDTTPGLRPLTLWEKPFQALKVLKRGTPYEGKKNYFTESKTVFEKLHMQIPFNIIVSQSTIAQGILSSKVMENENVPLVSIIHGTIKAELKNRFSANKTFKNWVRYLIIDFPQWIYELKSSNKKFFERTDSIIAVSNVLREQFKSDHPKYSSKVSVIYNGVDTEKFKRGSTKFEDFTLLYIGRINREKGIDITIDSLERLKEAKKEIKFIVIGSGVEGHIDEIRKSIKLKQLEAYVDYKGPLPNNELVEYYQKSHVFVFPTRRQEGHPMTLSEAYCCGLPLIATKMGGLKELIDNEENGYLIDENSVEQLTEKIMYLYENKHILSQLSNNAYEKGIATFSQKVMIDQYLKLMSSLV